jgi:hypothetical protein
VTINQSPWDTAPLPEVVASEAARPPWLDRVVELHVLAAHGDVAAGAAAAEWMASDHEVQRVWDAVERACEQLP